MQSAAETNEYLKRELSARSGDLAERIARLNEIEFRVAEREAEIRAKGALRSLGLSLLPRRQLTSRPGRGRCRDQGPQVRFRRSAITPARLLDALTCLAFASPAWPQPKDGTRSMPCRWTSSVSSRGAFDPCFPPEAHIL